MAGALTLKVYRGDFKTLLAWSVGKTDARNLAGFTIRVKPAGRDAYYLRNMLTFAHPEAHAQDSGDVASSSVNAPFHKFRWVHVPGLDHQGLDPLRGNYTYTVLPRYFDGKGHLLALDESLGATATIEVAPFVKGNLRLGFTRGFVQSQAFADHFSDRARFQPNPRTLLFNTADPAGTDKDGKDFSYADEYAWSGSIAHEVIFDLLREAETDQSVTRLEVFAYDLNEPDIVQALARIGRVKELRLILDNADLHTATKKAPAPKLEDQAAALIGKSAHAEVKRGNFSRYSHDKVFIVHDAQGPRRVLTGSTNFSVTGMYVNSNHVLAFDDRDIAGLYADVFNESWDDEVEATPFRRSEWSTTTYESQNQATPKTQFHFSPHTADGATAILDELGARIDAESQQPKNKRSVLFAVMGTGGVDSPVLERLEAIHANTEVFSFGISDSPGGIYLYKPDQPTGVLVTGKPTKTKLPPPFSQVRTLGLEHQVHHKFVVCGFNGPDPMVICGSSNLATKGEQQNGDNLLTIHDADVAAVFAIEALTLVDHFNFLNRAADEAAAKNITVAPEASKVKQAQDAGWHLGTTDAWTRPYYDPSSLKMADRLLFVS